MTRDVATAAITSVHSILAVTDGKASAAYYRDVLGFSIVRQPDGDEVGWHVVERDGFRIWLGEAVGSFRPIGECSDHSWFAYAVVDDVDALHSELVGRGAELWHDIETKAWGMREFAVTTLDGHRIVFGGEVSG